MSRVPQNSLSIALTVITWLNVWPFAFAGAGQTSKSYEVENAVYKMCRQANSLLDSGAYPAARNLLVNAASYDPTSYSSNVHLNLAECYRELGNYQQAVREAGLALKFDPNYDRAMYSMALSYYRMEHLDTALKYIRDFLRINRDANWRSRAQKMVAEIEVYRDLQAATRCIKSGRDSQALKLLRQAASHDPSPFSAAIHSNLAYVLQRSGDPEQAISEAHRALQLDPSDKTTVYTMGIAYQDMGRFDDAISWLRRYEGMETDQRARKNVHTFIQELADDRAKMSDPAGSSADYLDQLRRAGAVQKWPKSKLPIKIYISSGKGISGYRPSFGKFITQALDTWCEASGKKLSYTLVDSPKKCDLNVDWTPAGIPLKENNRERIKAGLTTVNTLDDGKITDVQLVVATINAFDSNRPIHDSECASVCMHEVGHALGLGHSTCVSDIMYFGSSAKQRGFPTIRDKTTIARLYADYPTLSFVPKTAMPKGPVKYLPPPAFLPPKAPDAEKLVPPLFLPPPVQTEEERLPPPLFTPPPLSASGKPEQKNAVQPPPRPPMFIPPSPGKQPIRERDNAKPPFFSPPPAK